MLLSICGYSIGTARHLGQILGMTVGYVVSVKFGSLVPSPEGLLKALVVVAALLHLEAGEVLVALVGITDFKVICSHN